MSLQLMWKKVEFCLLLQKRRCDHAVLYHAKTVKHRALQKQLLKAAETSDTEEAKRILDEV